MSQYTVSDGAVGISRCSQSSQAGKEAQQQALLLL
jgi:hypothetical protein